MFPHKSRKNGKFEYLYPNDRDTFLLEKRTIEGNFISQCAEKGWDSMKPEEKYEHIFKCISEICFDYFLSTKTQELLKVNINNTFSQLIDEVVEERNQEIHERFKEKAEKYISE